MSNYQKITKKKKFITKNMNRYKKNWVKIFTEQIKTALTNSSMQNVI